MAGLAGGERTCSNSCTAGWRENGVDVLLKARLIDVIADGTGRVEGVVIERPGGETETIGCGALVLATSGFGANHEMIARYMPEAKAAQYHGHEGNDGLGMTLGARLGGAVGDMGSYQGYGMLADPQGISLPPGVIVEGGLLLNAHGRRFRERDRRHRRHGASGAGSARRLRLGNL